MKPPNLLAIFALLTSSLAYATPAEETTTLTQSISQTTAGVRLVRFELEKEHPGPVVRLTVKGCTSCLTSSPVWLKDTETTFDVGVPTSLGANRTRVSGYAVRVGGRDAECDLTPAQFRGFVISAVNAGAGDPIG